MKNKAASWLLCVSSYLMQIPFLVYFIYVMMTEEGTENEFFVGLIIVLSCVLAVITFVLCGVNILLAALGFNKKLPVPYKTTMVVKLSMIPFYIINFVIWGMFIAVCLMFPFFIFFGVLLFIVSLVCTYLIVLATGANNIVYAIKDFKRNKSLTCLLCIIGHFFFCIDVIASIVLYTINNSEQAGAETAYI